MGQALDQVGILLCECLRLRAPEVHRAGKTVDYTYNVTLAYGRPGDLRHSMDVRLKGSFRAKSASEIDLFEANFG